MFALHGLRSHWHIPVFPTVSKVVMATMREKGAGYRTESDSYYSYD